MAEPLANVTLKTGDAVTVALNLRPEEEAGLLTQAKAAAYRLINFWCGSLKY